tara:strand:+ start:145 stop:585 length:441 start_codon:yes stop_codon:yes gene_type:complete
MGDFCYFFRESGYVVYNNIVLNSKDNIEYHNKINSEMISAKDIYENGGKFYYKSYYLSDDTNSQNVRFLEWRMTRNGDWDWFVTNIIPSSINSITKYTNIKLHIEDYKKDISNYISKISDRYNIDKGKINILTDEIKSIIDKFEFE